MKILVKLDMSKALLKQVAEEIRQDPAVEQPEPDSIASIFSDIEQGGESAEPERVVAPRWQDSLTNTELAKISLARAFVVNPEVLVLHRPLYGLKEKTASLVLNLIREQVVHRGLCLPQSSARNRRPR